MDVINRSCLGKFYFVIFPCVLDESQVSTIQEMRKEIKALKELGRRAHPNVMSMLGIIFTESEFRQKQ